MKELFEIEKVKVNKEEAKSFDQEDFSKTAFELLREVGIHSSMVSTLLPYRKNGWDKHQAIVGGHLIRANKLIRAILDQASQRRMEVVHIFFRLIYECTVNARYLMLKNDEEIFEDYIKYSLREDKRLLDRIDDNLKSENRSEKEIEKRMKKSISRYYERGGYSIEEINSSNKSPWGGDNIYFRAKELGMNEAHLLMFSGQSSQIHGNWHDLILYHLKENKDGTYQPVQDWHSPDSRIINAVSFLSIPLLKDFINYLSGTEVRETTELYDEIISRILLLENLHEDYLQGIT